MSPKTQPAQPLLRCRKCGSINHEFWAGFGTQAWLSCEECSQEESVQVTDLFEHPWPKMDEENKYDDATIAVVNKHLADEWNTRAHLAPAPTVPDAKAKAADAINRAYVDQLAESERLRDALALILPMAKGYATAHPVGNNCAFVAQAAELLESAPPSLPTSEPLKTALSRWKEKMEALPLGHADTVKGDSSYNWMNHAYRFFSDFLPFGMTEAVLTDQAAHPMPRGAEELLAEHNTVHIGGGKFDGGAVDWNPQAAPTAEAPIDTQLKRLNETGAQTYMLTERVGFYGLPFEYLMFYLDEDGNRCLVPLTDSGVCWNESGMERLRALEASAPSGLVAADEIEKFLQAVSFVKFPAEAEDALNNLCNAMNDAHKVQPVADVRGMVEVLEDEVVSAVHLAWANAGDCGRKPVTHNALQTELKLIYQQDGPVTARMKALASARHAMGGEGVDK